MQEYKKRYGERVALWGAVGAQTTFAFSTPGEIRREVKLRIETLGRAGLVLCPAYDIDEPDVPWENILAFLEAAEEYGSPLHSEPTQPAISKKRLWSGLTPGARHSHFL